MSGVLLGLGGGRGSGRETEQGAEASRGGLRGPKLMGGHCGYCVVKDTCKYIKQKWKGEEAQRVDTGEGGEPIHVARTMRGRGTKREAWTEPGCAERQARLQQAHKKQTESVHCDLTGSD